MKLAVVGFCPPHYVQPIQEAILIGTNQLTGRDSSTGRLGGRMRFHLAPIIGGGGCDCGELACGFVARSSTFTKLLLTSRFSFFGDVINVDLIEVVSVCP